jgi:cytochrome c551/c552
MPPSRQRSTLRATIARATCSAHCNGWSLHALLASVALLVGCSESPPKLHVAGGEAGRGKAAIERYGCAACHTVPGIPGYGANVGPPLGQLAARAYLAGVLPNLPHNLVRWLQDPPAVAPRTVMPKLGVSEAEARDMAA